MTDSFAIVGFSEPSLWSSCQSITSNLAESYRQAFGDHCQFFSVRRKYSPDPVTIRQTVQQIFESRPSRIILTDDPYPHPRPLIEELKKKFGAQMPPISFHVYGDFVLGAHEWKALEETLIGTKVSFIASSLRQANLVGSLIVDGAQNMEIAPFPVSENRFHFDAAIRSKTRADFGLNTDDRLLLYTGRMTSQKNVLRLLRETIASFRTERQPTFLFLAGVFDHLGDPFAPQLPLPGEFYEQFKRVLATVPEPFRNRIRFLGHLPSEKLFELYNAADLFVSLSTFHDEDYGMSPAEALMCGCRAVLTNWGGYAGFDQGLQTIKYVPVHLDGEGLFFDHDDVQKALSAKFETDTLEARLLRSKSFAAGFSISAVAKKLIEIHRDPPSEFHGFQSKMTELAERISNFALRWHPVFPDGMTANTFYSSIYSPYWGDHRG